MQNNNAWLWLFGAAAVVIILAGLRSISHIITPFLLASFMAIICIPPLTWMRRKGLPAAVALLVLFVGVGLSFFLLFLAIRSAVEDLALQAPLYQERMAAMIAGIQSYAQARGVPQEFIPQGFMVDTATITEVARMLARGVGQFTAYLFFVLLAFMFILLEERTLPDKFKAAFPSKRRAQVRTRHFLRSVNRYLAVKTTTSIITGAIIGTGLSIVGVDFAILWGILAGLLNFIPTIGSIIAAVPAVLIALLGLGFSEAVIVVIIYLVPNVLIGSIIEPRLMGQTLGLSPIVVLISLLIWGWVFGPVGMLLSILLTMIVKLALESSAQTQWLGILLSDKAKRR
ncbi:AI-2E family transporter [Marinimicrobium sp. ABcell2]|uniref:AI-2E family transporter n=1 Tax=Marinimicrobium sp. ABcell2 TaxID=3069751 RepID=UPI0027B69796|nr:AI-2E family transporter [Marinimicrobium sp. ABcell2]MDQ2077777.1 AI-2E family transporter [Marinimicrobium sp. ABcell2]